MYVEAYKEAHVKEAIRGLRVFYQSKGAKMVPLKEMVDAITINRKAKASISALLPASSLHAPGGSFPAFIFWHWWNCRKTRCKIEETKQIYRSSVKLGN